jgi:disulfide bond formation protein DsbB
MFNWIISKKFNTQSIFIIIFFSCIFALILAYISQYFFDLEPCQLCLWQRKPFFVIITLASIFLAIPQLKKYQDWGIKIIVLLLLVNSAIAFYHFGVEQKWFRGLDSCAFVASNIDSIEKLKLELKNTKAVRCDQPQFVFLKLSIAGWNMIYCLILAGFVLRARKKFIKMP